MLLYSMKLLTHLYYMGVEIRHSITDKCTYRHNNELKASYVQTVCLQCYSNRSFLNHVVEYFYY
jgi:hypothetical protein